jgi:hypothetical protein
MYQYDESKFGQLRLANMMNMLVKMMSIWQTYIWGRWGWRTYIGHFDEDVFPCGLGVPRIVFVLRTQSVEWGGVVSHCLHYHVCHLERNVAQDSPINVHDICSFFDFDVGDALSNFILRSTTKATQRHSRHVRDAWPMMYSEGLAVSYVLSGKISHRSLKGALSFPNN